MAALGAVCLRVHSTYYATVVNLKSRYRGIGILGTATGV